MTASLPSLKVLVPSVLLFLLTSGTCHALESAESPKNDFVAEFFKDLRHDSVLSDFEQTKYVAQAERSLKSSGKMLFTATDGLCWKMLKPFARSWLFFKDGVTEYLPDGTSKSVSSDRNGMFNGVLLSVLNSGINGDTERLTEAFEVTDGGHDGENDVRSVFLKPRDANIAKIIYRIKLERRNDVLQSITLMEQGNGYTRMTFRNQLADGDDVPKVNEFCAFR